MVRATRWEELSDTVMQIGTMAHTADPPTLTLALALALAQP
jgi:hypothetical protein